VGRGVLGHHRHALLAHDGRRHPHAAGAAVRRTGARVLHHEALCIALQKKDREIALHGYESGRIVRLPGGEYIEVHQPVDQYEIVKLVDFETNQPLVVRPNDQGRIPWHENFRASLSRWFFEDRLAPVTQAELEEARAHQHHTLDHIAAEEDAEIQGMHERAGVGDAPHHPIDDGRQSETAVRPSNVIVPDGDTKDAKDED
jgi:ubiquinol-cytochrome c reductase cytochrome b subunit